MSADDFFEIDIQQQADLHYRWTLSQRGVVVAQGVEPYVANCLAQASVGVDPTSRIAVGVDNVPAGSFLAVRTQLESTPVALEIAKAMLTRQV